MSIVLLGVGIISFRSPKLKLRNFNAKLVCMPNSLGNGSFYSFESMVIRFLIEMESSNLDHQNSSDCILHPDYSNLLSKFILFLHIAPL